MSEDSSATLAEDHPNDDKDENGTKATTAEFFCPISGDQGAKEIIHREVFAALNYKYMPAAEVA